MIRQAAMPGRLSVYLDVENDAGDGAGGQMDRWMDGERRDEIETSDVPLGKKVGCSLTQCGLVTSGESPKPCRPAN